MNWGKLTVMNRQELKETIKKERSYYPCLKGSLHTLYAWLCQDRDYYVFKYIKRLRMTEYHYALRDSNKLHWIGYIWWKHRKNKLGRILNLDMGEGAFGSGLYIAHTNIIVGSAKIGSNCKLHGQNCIGSGAKLGDNCELWVGAKVFGPCKLADNITVAAGAVVVDSFEEKGITIGGVPARKIK